MNLLSIHTIMQGMLNNVIINLKLFDLLKYGRVTASQFSNLQKFKGYFCVALQDC